MIISPPHEGGLGLIDPMFQCKALLGKFVVRSMLPGNEPWKLLLHERMKELVPFRGGQWKRNVRWWFVHEDMPSVFTSYKFFNSLLRAWKDLLPNLVHKQPIWEDEWKRQPICWNCLIKVM